MLQTCFNTLNDPRVQGRVTYEFDKVLLLVVLSLLSNSKGYRDIGVFIEERFEVLKKHLKLDWKRRPAYTTVRNILLGLSPTELEDSFRKHAKELLKDKEKLQDGKVIKQIAFDGKALCGSVDNSVDKRFIQLISGFCVNGKFILCHYEVDEKSNEIPAVQLLINELGLSGYLITADAMHCQKKRLKAPLKQGMIC